MNERWKQLLFNKNLEVSSFGRLRSIASGKLWKLPLSRNGYVQVTLYHTELKKGRSLKAHRLVAEMFLPTVVGKTHINHKDFNKQNNHVNNLEWCTQIENIKHYYKYQFKHIVTDEQVLYIRTNIEKLGARKIARELGIKEGYILGIANGTNRPDVHVELIREKRTSFPKTVGKYSMDGELVETYPSTRNAAISNNTRLSAIQRVLTGERHLHKGFIYRYA